MTAARRRRTGLTTIRAIAFRACQMITAWTPVISVIYAGNPLLIAALNTANAACSELVMQADEVLETAP